MFSVTNVIERRIVAALLVHLSGAGWEPVLVLDGGDGERVSTHAEAIEAVFAVDVSHVVLRNADGRKHSVMLVCGNDEDIISDWSYATGDGDGFNAAMDGFDPLDAV